MRKRKPSRVAVSEPSRGALKVNHWSIQNGSGMHHVAQSLADAETRLGLVSVLADPTKPETWDQFVDADIQVIHTHFPSPMKRRLTKPLRLVWVGHGTPDHVFQGAAMEAEQNAYGHGDPLMLMQHWLKVAHARVTFWDRHQAIYDTMLSRGARRTDLVPMGVDTAFWGAGTSSGKYAGSPSVFTAENCHYIKWPYDLMTCWPWVMEQYPDSKLHAIYLPRDVHRVFFPWVNANGCSYGSYISPNTFPPELLRNAFQSTDYTVGLVRYGDINHLSLQANAAGATTISYTGNPHADYWIPEGDQRVIASELCAIFRGEREKRVKSPVPDVQETAEAMRAIYEAIV